MKCPSVDCGRKIQVSDSRERNGGHAVRRRRKCNYCGITYTTYEIIQADPINKNNHMTLSEGDNKNIDCNYSFNEIRKHLNLLAESLGIKL
ncbi:MAG: hypothetical protein V4471_03820 [Pseudomonadota bacterium]